MLSQLSVEVPRTLLAHAQRYPAVKAGVANANSELVLRSAKAAAEQGLMIPVLIGNPVVIRQNAATIDWDISRVRIEYAADEKSAAVKSVAMARAGEVAAIVKGDVHTEVLLRAVLDRKVGLRTGRTLSHVFHMTVPGSDKALCITDAVLNVQPTLEQKLHVVKNARSLLHALGNNCPRVALLSATETATAAMPSSMDAVEVCRIARKERWKGLRLDGPLAFDLAVSEDAAKIKQVTSEVAGQANVLVVPNIETGNALFKMMVHFQSAAAAGIILGAAVPIMLTSRADPLEARLASAALSSIYAGATTA